MKRSCIFYKSSYLSSGKFYNTVHVAKKTRSAYYPSCLYIMPTICKAFEGILPHSRLAELTRDCAVVFNCKSINAKEENYSTGSTYFTKANDQPRTQLEKMAQEIFEYHSSTLSFRPSNSGAEWWTQVVDYRDDIGVHWDRDYALEEEQGVHVYPYLGTVTYLSDIGAPTVVFANEGTSNASENAIGPISELILSAPKATNHIAFNGKMLHAAPLQFNESDDESGPDDSGNSDASSSSSSAQEEETDIEQLLANLTTKRITFLVNVWINHIPSQAKKCPKNIIKKLSLVPSIQQGKTLLNMQNHATALTCTLNEADAPDRVVQLPFNNSDINYKVLLPFPSAAKVLKHSREGWPVRYLYQSASFRGEVVIDTDDEYSDIINLECSGDKRVICAAAESESRAKLRKMN